MSEGVYQYDVWNQSCSLPEKVERRVEAEVGGSELGNSTTRWDTCKDKLMEIKPQPFCEQTLKNILVERK